MLNKHDLAEALIKAREHYREYGGYKGAYYSPNGKSTCALGSIYCIWDPMFQGFNAATIMRDALTEHVPSGGYNVPTYNDSFTDRDERRAAILDLYDATIKDVENGDRVYYQ